MTDHEAEGLVEIGGVQLRWVRGKVKDLTSRSETTSVTKGKTKSRSRKGFFGDVVTTHESPVTTTTTDTVRDFWVVGNEGAETHVETKESVEVRNGHSVLVLMYKGLPAMLVNCDIMKWWYMPEVVDTIMSSEFGSFGRVSLGGLAGSTFGVLFFLGGASDIPSSIAAFVFGLLGVACALGGPVRFFLHRRAKQRFSAFHELLTNWVEAKLVSVDS